MNKIKVTIKKDNIIFSLYNSEITSENLNNTNVINTQNLKFTEEYINENFELIYSFFNLIILKSNVKTAIINNLEIAEVVTRLLQNLNSITKIIFIEDRELNYTISSNLLYNKNAEYIECYSMPEIMFNRFQSNIINTRCKILFSSEFMKYNNIDTYSKLCNKDSVIIDSYLTASDVDDIIYFFKTNKNLKKLVIKGYKKCNLITFLKMLKENYLNRIMIILIEDSNISNELITDAKDFPKLNKKYNVNIKIKYSKHYKEKNKIKEYNIIFIRTGVLIILIMIGALIYFIKQSEAKNKSNIDDNLKIINSVIEDNTESDTSTSEVEQESKSNYNSPYYKKYENSYDSLYKLNNDTVGWITINNTNINYPVVQTNDNKYYLNHAFNKIVNGFGWIFVDYRNNLEELDDNTIVYGHDIPNDYLMFGSLRNTLKDKWNSNENNLIINFSIKGNSTKWKIFSAYTIDNTNDYLINKFNTKENFQKYINREKDRSIKNFNEDVTINDKILTLSTCYNDPNHRLVVHAKKIN